MYLSNHDFYLSLLYTEERLCKYSIETNRFTGFIMGRTAQTIAFISTAARFAQNNTLDVLGMVYIQAILLGIIAKNNNFCAMC